MVTICNYFSPYVRSRAMNGEEPFSFFLFSFLFFIYEFFYVLLCILSNIFLVEKNVISFPLLLISLTSSSGI